MQPQAVVIGAGFAGLAAATTLGNKGWRVTVVEKNEAPEVVARTMVEGRFPLRLGT
jgi:phytoene desaturase